MFIVPHKDMEKSGSFAENCIYPVRASRGFRCAVYVIPRPSSPDLRPRACPEPFTSYRITRWRASLTIANVSACPNAQFNT